MIYSAINKNLVIIIPKSTNANMIKDYRHISCCTTIYKIISKIMAKRLSKVLGNIIDVSQTTFVPGKHIQDHILLAYELIKGYNTKGSPPRCMLQMDLQKACKIVEWFSLEAILKELSFPFKFIIWIMITISTMSYRYKVNGENTCTLKANLRQGDPISLFLFVIMIDYLHRSLQILKCNPNFNFHSKCEKLNLIKLSFVDYLLLFSIGDTISIGLLMIIFNEFTRSTGMSVNPRKCKAYFRNKDDNTK